MTSNPQAEPTPPEQNSESEYETDTDIEDVENEDIPQTLSDDILDQEELLDGQPDDYDLMDDEYIEMDMGGLITSMLSTEDGETVCSALVNIGNQIEMQNKILVKMLSQMKN